MAAYDKSGDMKGGFPNASGAAVPPPYVYGGVPGAYLGIASAPQIPAGGYPGAPVGYPTTAAYHYPQGPPPPYSVAVSQPGAVPAGSYPAAYVSMGYQYGYPMYSQPAMAHPNTTVVMPGGYDAGARFDGVSRAGVPPPPPGVMPNAAQMAMMQGQRVVLGQQKGEFMSGGGVDAGYTIW